MPASTQRGSSVVYVADSVREFPADVQDWLGRKGLRAVASPNVYDMLARLARGHRYAAIIVSIESVDWSELEFFDHAVRAARGARIYVAGRLQQRSKLEAACKRGAELFDLQLLEEDLAPPVVTADGSEAAAEAAPAAAEASRPAPEPIVSEPAAPARADESARPVSPGQFPPRPRRIFPESTDWTSARPGRPSSERFSDYRDRIQNDEPAATESVVSQEAEPQSAGSEAQSAALNQDEESSPAVIPFPWAPSPDRPRRTPPQHEGQESVDNEAGSQDERAGPSSPGLDSGVRLTPEEIAALLGDSAETDASTRGSET